jgi:DME family drug/metabolite transporter
MPTAPPWIPQPMSVQRARLAAIGAALLFSTGGAAIKMSGFSGTQIASLRSGVAAVALALWLRGRLTWSRDIAGAAVVYAATLTLFVNATKLTTAANAIFLQSTAPLYLLLLAPLLLREPVGRRDVWYLAAVGTGLIACFAGRPAATATAPDPALGNLFGLAAGFTWALTLLALRRTGRGDASGDAGITAVVAGNARGMVGARPFSLPLPRGASPAEWATIAYLGIFQIGVAYMCLTAAVRHLPALDLSLLLLLEPVLNPVWAWLICGEAPGLWVMAGGSLIIGATALKFASDIGMNQEEPA